MRLHRTCEGFLLNISTVGALVRLPSSQTPEKRIRLLVEWNAQSLELVARVVRSTPQQMATESATLARTEYQVAIEFSEVPPASASLLTELLNFA